MHSQLNILYSNGNESTTNYSLKVSKPQVLKFNATLG
jgi:hypothetical protein